MANVQTIQTTQVIGPYDTTFAQGYRHLLNIGQTGKNIEIVLKQNTAPSKRFPFGQPQMDVAGRLQSETGIQKLGKLVKNSFWTLRADIPKTEIYQPYVVQMVQTSKGEQRYVNFEPLQIEDILRVDCTIQINENSLTESRLNQVYIVLPGYQSFGIVRICMCFQEDGTVSLTAQFIFEGNLQRIAQGESYLAKENGQIVTKTCEDDNMIACLDQQFANFYGMQDRLQDEYKTRVVDYRPEEVTSEELLETKVLSDADALDRYTLEDLTGLPMKVNYFDPSTNTGHGSVEMENGDIIAVKYHYTQIPAVKTRTIRFLEPGEVVYPQYNIHTHVRGPLKDKQHFNAINISFTPQPEEIEPVTFENTIMNPGTEASA